MWEVWTLKVFIDHKLGGSGKGFFIKRLVDELKNQGVQCSFKQKGCDIALGVIRWRECKGKIPRVLRIDGAFFQDRPRSYWINKRIKKASKLSDAVIWQSEFCKTFANSFIKIKHPHQYVIHNGANPNAYLIKRKVLPYKFNILASARWKNRPQKGLRELINLARLYVEINEDACFWIAGKSEIKSPHKRIKIMGHLDEDRLSDLIVSCDAMTYLVAYDWCPNALVEGLVAGLPVVYLEGTGVEELAKGSGIGVKRLQPLKLGMTKHKPIPHYDYQETITALNNIRKFESKARTDLFIDVAASKYKKVFEDVLERRR